MILIGTARKGIYVNWDDCKNVVEPTDEKLHMLMADDTLVLLKEYADPDLATAGCENLNGLIAAASENEGGGVIIIIEEDDF
jgi:hypothetical protein